MPKSKVNIQREIEEILEREFEAMLDSLSDNKLFEIVKSGKIEKMKLDDVKQKVLGGRNK